MSRMVRENSASGLRERLYFARLMLDDLRQGVEQGAPRARLLGLRGAVLFHLYTVPVGILRQAATSYRVSGAESLISLAALADAFHAAGVDAPECRLVEQARRHHDDPLYWLDGEMRAAFGAPGLGLRPEPPAEEAGLGLRAEDIYRPLASGDLQRLEDCIQRLESLYRDCLSYMEEW